jgi:hypothetical protein
MGQQYTRRMADLGFRESEGFICSPLGGYPSASGTSRMWFAPATAFLEFDSPLGAEKHDYAASDCARDGYVSYVPGIDILNRLLKAHIRS